MAACELLLLPVQRFLELCLPPMRTAGWGRLVAITSIAVREPQPMLVLSNTLARRAHRLSQERRR